MERLVPGPRAGLEERYTLADALAVATYLNVFVRHCRGGADGEPGAAGERHRADRHERPTASSCRASTTRCGSSPTTCGESALDVHVDCDTHDLVEVYVPGGWPHRVADLGPFPLLDVTATAAENERRADRERRQPLAHRPSRRRNPICGRGRPNDRNPESASSAPIPAATNSFEHPDRVTVEAEALDAFGDGTLLQFPAASHTVITTGEEARR